MISHKSLVATSSQAEHLRLSAAQSVLIIGGGIVGVELAGEVLHLPAVCIRSYLLSNGTGCSNVRKLRVWNWLKRSCIDCTYMGLKIISKDHSIVLRCLRATIEWCSVQDRSGQGLYCWFQYQANQFMFACRSLQACQWENKSQSSLPATDSSQTSRPTLEGALKSGLRSVACGCALEPRPKPHPPDPLGARFHVRTAVQRSDRRWGADRICTRRHIT